MSSNLVNTQHEITEYAVCVFTHLNPYILFATLFISPNNSLKSDLVDYANSTESDSFKHSLVDHLSSDTKISDYCEIGEEKHYFNNNKLRFTPLLIFHPCEFIFPDFC